MRALAVATLLLLVAITAPGPVVAPGMPNHLKPFTGTLVPSENWTLSSLGIDDAPLVGGWVFLLQAQTSGTLAARLWIGTFSRTWTISASNSWYGTTVLPVDGYYNLTLSNPGSSDVAFSLYYDQTCNCISKQFPVDPVAGHLYVPSGYVIFNTDVPGASTVSAEFVKPPALTLKITAATLAQPGGVWPDDFTMLGATETPVQRQAAPGVPPVWLYELNVSVPQATRVYYFVQAASFNAAIVSQYATIVSFRATVTATPPLPLVPIILLGAALALGIGGGAMLWRGRRQPSSKTEPTKTRPRGKGKGAKSDARRRGGGRGGPRTRTAPEGRRRS